MEICEWKFVEDYDGDGHYDTDCGNSFYFAEGNIVDNEFHFCPYCGRRVQGKIEKCGEK